MVLSRRVPHASCEMVGDDYNGGVNQQTQRFWALARGAIFTLLIPGTVTYYVPHRLRAFDQPRSAPWLALAAVFIALGGGLLLACIFDFAWQGLGTLSPIDPPRSSRRVMRLHAACRNRPIRSVPVGRSRSARRRRSPAASIGC